MNENEEKKNDPKPYPKCSDLGCYRAGNCILTCPTYADYLEELRGWENRQQKKREVAKKQADWIRELYREAAEEMIVKLRKEGIIDE